MIRSIFLLGLIVCFTGTRAAAQHTDLEILKKINPRYPDSRFWSAASNTVYWVPATASLGTLTAGWISHDKNLQRKGYELLISCGVSSILSTAMKSTVRRTRPADKYPHEIFVTSPANGMSFPSGHASLSFAMATSLSLQYKKWYVVAPSFLWAGMVSYSRMYKGYHYPSDVIMGSLVGAGSGALSHYLTRWLFRH